MMIYRSDLCLMISEFYPPPPSYAFATPGLKGVFSRVCGGPPGAVAGAGREGVPVTLCLGLVDVAHCVCGGLWLVAVAGREGVPPAPGLPFYTHQAPLRAVGRATSIPFHFVYPSPSSNIPAMVEIN